MEQPSKPTWTRKHLLGLEELSAEEIRFILDTADSFKEVSTRSRSRKCRRCAGGWWSTHSGRTRRARARASRWPPRGFGRHHRLFREGLERLQGRDADRHRPQHRGDGGGRDRDPPPGGRGGAAAEPRGQVLGGQRRRRGPRAPDAGPAGSVHHPRAIRADRGAEGGDRRRHRQQPRGPLEPVGADQAGGRGDPGRPADAAAADLREAGARRGAQISTR